MQNCGMPNFEPITELNLSEDLFFLSSPNFGLENELILSGEIFLLVFIILKFLGPPLLKILRTLLFTAFLRDVKQSTCLFPL